jgi:hypothetical protein
MVDVSLSGIDPARWPEIRRRVAILREYTALNRPTSTQTALHAERMGVRRATFYALARVWRESGDPRQVFGAGKRNATRARNEANDLPEASLKVIRDVIARLGTWAEDQALLREAKSRLAAEGLMPAAAQTVRSIMDLARSNSTDPSPFPPAILIERCHLRLPLRQDDGMVLPAAWIAIAVPENVILTYRLGTDNAPPKAGEVVGDIRKIATANAEVRPLVTPHPTDDVPGYAPGLIDGTRSLRLRRVLGGAISGIVFLVRSRSAGGTMKLRNRFEAPLSMSDVDTAFADAVRRHNAVRRTVARFSIDENDQQDGVPRSRSHT